MGAEHKQYMTIDEVTAYLGISKNTAYAWVCRRKLPFIKVGRLLRFDVEVINRWMGTHSVGVID